MAKIQNNNEVRDSIYSSGFSFKKNALKNGQIDHFPLQGSLNQSSSIQKDPNDNFRNF